MDPALNETLRSASGVLFLCSGNIMRSAFADCYARHLACALPVRSAGTTYRNRRMHPEVARALAARGVPQELLEAFRPTFLGDLRLDSCEFVLGMTREHLEHAVAAGASRDRVALLAAVGGAGGEIADPLFHGGWPRAAQEIAARVEDLVRAVRG